ncbi:MAG: carbohydrate kinase [Rhodanobacteraceae bacterium]
MSRIVCFGEALIDFHGRIEPEDATPAFIAHAGGGPANVAVAVARLGGDVAFVGMLGADVFGDLIERRLREAGVDVRYARRTDAAHTALAFVTLDAEGERSFSFYRPPAADLLFRDADFDAEAFEGLAIFHCGSCSLTEPKIAEATLSGMRRARAAGALVSFDMNLRPALWPRDADPAPTVWSALELAELVKLSAEEFEFLVASVGNPDAMLERLWRGAVRFLIVTDGTAPIRWFTRTASGSVPAYHVRVVDSTGAGDAFVGGLLHGFAKEPVDASAFDAWCADADRRDSLLRFAAACGALAVMRTGSFAAMPDRAAVISFLEKYR